MLEPSRHEKGLSPNLDNSGIPDGSTGKTTPNAVNTIGGMVKTPTSTPAEPERGKDVWYRGWECGHDADAAYWGAEAWRAYKGGADLDAPHTSARTFPDLLTEIDALEAE